MKRIVRTLNLWVNRRFIYIVEVLGYAASAIMAVGAIYCFVTYEDVLAHANGALAPLSRSLAVAEEYVVYDWLIESGENVEAGAPIARVVTDTQSLQRLRASRHLAKARACLDQAGEDSDRALRFVNDALDGLDVVPPTQTMQTPIRGTVILQQDSDGTARLARGTSLATTYDLEILLCTAELEASKAKKVKEGQVARVTLDEVEEPVVGRVVGEPEAKEGGTIQFRFEQVPPEVQHVFRDTLTVEPASFSEVRVEIVVGRRSLFVKLFGRSS